MLNGEAGSSIWKGTRTRTFRGPLRASSSRQSSTSCCRSIVAARCALCHPQCATSDTPVGGKHECRNLAGTGAHLGRWDAIEQAYSLGIRLVSARPVVMSRDGSAGPLQHLIGTAPAPGAKGRHSIKCVHYSSNARKRPGPGRARARKCPTLRNQSQKAEGAPVSNAAVGAATSLEFVKALGGLSRAAG